MEIETNYLILKKDDSNIVGTYYIYMKNPKKLIGSITYRGYHFDQKMGDIGSIIHSSYKNNGLGKEALFKIIELLNQNNIPDFWITCESKNEVSKHIINKYLDIESIKEIEDVIQYRCSTNLQNQKTENNKKQI